jgi:hypothetical protein
MKWQLIGNISGQDGRDGKSVDPSELSALIDVSLTKAVSAMPKPSDGKDGAGITQAMIDRNGYLILTFSDGSMKEAGPVVGKDGANGADGRDIDPAIVQKQIADLVATIPKPKDGRDGIDGKDGVGFDAADLDLDTKEVILTDTTKGISKRVFFPFTRYRDIYTAGQVYLKGDQVTLDGAQWIATDTTMKRPGTDESGWQLSAKRGPTGPRGPEGPKGPAGKDHTQMGSDGRTWQGAKPG